ncbi:glycosyltransferase [Herbivorax sp. ANBcel31]|uniref:glycosyltransferase n=1 Tax=Herbivorax sp. ANBcel31 TaxID=3069754 RepID=UPI0027B48D26|nr:glycosyltransferase [Herbivorax sp. ANBcel31]MDQ2087049.1 glycosyltransferase [Herbivorax sp. ANBcel31]
MSNIYSDKAIKFIIAITGIYIAYYLFWRITRTINHSALLFSLVLLFGELYGIVNYFLFALMTKDIKKEERVTPLKNRSVDVFVPTYNEDIEVLEATLIGAINMNYEHKTYVLDDGRRSEVFELSKQLGCEYITREDNKNAKAGNINEALKKTSGEFIVILDADMVPQPDFIEKTLGYFKDSKTAIVQMPQEFYNLDSVQHPKNNSNWHEQQLFYHVIQPGRNSINAAFWCGSPSIVRREALENVGGVATESITEDFLTSIKLNSKGWKIQYHNEVLAFGIAPQSIHAFNLQRLRWAQGAMKILKSKNNPLIVPGLTIKQRLAHFSAIFTYFESYQKLIYIMVPVIVLFTGILPFKLTSGYEFFIHWAPYFLLLILSNKALGRGYFKYVPVEEYNILKMFTFIRASFSLFFSKKLSFRVTPKSVESSIKVKERHEVFLHIIVFAVVVLSFSFGIINLIGETFINYSSKVSAVVAVLWAGLNGYLLLLTLLNVLKRDYYRNGYRFHVHLDSRVVELTGTQLNASVKDISNRGIGLEDLDENITTNKSNVRVCLPDGILNLKGHIEYKKASEDGHKNIGLKFDELSLEQRMRLYKFLYVTVPRHIYNSSTGLQCNIEYCPEKNSKDLVVNSCDFKLDIDNQKNTPSLV